MASWEKMGLNQRGGILTCQSRDGLEKVAPRGRGQEQPQDLRGDGVLAAPLHGPWVFRLMPGRSGRSERPDATVCALVFCLTSCTLWCCQI